MLAIPLSRDHTSSPQTQTEAVEREGRLSPDCKWLACQSDQNRGCEVYVQGFPGREGKWQVSAGGGSWPVWSRDGKELFLVSNGHMMEVEVKSGGTFEFSAPKALFELSSVAASFATSSMSARMASDSCCWTQSKRLRPRRCRSFSTGSRG